MIYGAYGTGVLEFGGTRWEANGKSNVLLLLGPNDTYRASS